MPYIKIWIHSVWATKNRSALMDKSIRPQIFDHIRQNAKQKGIFIDHINGVENHIHCLISMTAVQNIAKLINLIKGESSYWINQNKITKHRFEWQDEYFAVSISESHVDIVRAYIRNQEEHHKNVTWEQEVEEFMTKFGFEIIKG